MNSPFATSRRLKLWGAAMCLLLPLPGVWIWLQFNPPSSRAGWAPLPGLHNTASLFAAWAMVLVELLILRWITRRVRGDRGFAPSLDAVAVSGFIAAVSLSGVLIASCALRIVDRSTARVQLSAPDALSVLRTASDLWGSPTRAQRAQGDPLDPIERLAQIAEAPAGSMQNGEFRALCARASVFRGGSWFTDAFSVNFEGTPDSLGSPVYEQFGWPLRVITSHHGDLGAPDVWPIIRRGGAAMVPTWVADTIVYSRVEFGGLAVSAMLVGLLLTLAGEATRYMRDRLKRGKCPRCGYPQRGLASSACPECGATRNPATQAGPLSSVRRMSVSDCLHCVRHVRWFALATLGTCLAVPSWAAPQDAGVGVALAEGIARMQTAIGRDHADLVSRVNVCPGAVHASEVLRVARGYRAARDCVQLIERAKPFCSVGADDLPAYESLAADARSAVLGLQAAAFVRLQSDGGQDDGVQAASALTSALQALVSQDWRAMAVATPVAIASIRVMERLIEGGDLNIDDAQRLRSAVSPLDKPDPAGVIVHQLSRFEFAFGVAERLADVHDEDSGRRLNGLLWPDERAAASELINASVAENCRRLATRAAERLGAKSSGGDLVETCMLVAQSARAAEGCGGWGKILASKLEQGAAAARSIRTRAAPIVDALAELSDPSTADVARESLANAVFRYRRASEAILQARADDPTSVVNATEAALRAARTPRFDYGSSRCDGRCARFIERDLVDRCRVAIWLADAADAANAAGSADRAGPLCEAVRLVMKHLHADRGAAADLLAWRLDLRLHSRGHAKIKDAPPRIRLAAETRTAIVQDCPRWYPEPEAIKDPVARREARSWMADLSDAQLVLAAMGAESALARGMGSQPSWQSAEALQIVSLLSISELVPSAEALGAIIASTATLEDVKRALLSAPVADWWSAQR